MKTAKDDAEKKVAELVEHMKNWHVDELIKANEEGWNEATYA